MVDYTHKSVSRLMDLNFELESFSQRYSFNFYFPRMFLSFSFLWRFSTWKDGIF